MAGFLFCALVFTAGCGGSTGGGSTGQPSSAVIVGPFNNSSSGQAIAISDAATLKRLEEFFPGYKERPSSAIAGLWDMKYWVYFELPDHDVVRLIVSENENARFWSAGRGDFTTNGDFNKFVDELRKADPGGSGESLEDEKG